MDKKNEPELNSDILLADILLRLTVLEKLLFNNKTIDQEEYYKNLEELASIASKAILKNIKDFTESLDKKKLLLDKDKIS
jgi:hypothetical protein